MSGERVKFRAMGSGCPKLEVRPDLELHSESLHRPTIPCCDAALTLQQEKRYVRNRIRSRIMCKVGIPV